MPSIFLPFAGIGSALVYPLDWFASNLSLSDTDPVDSWTDSANGLAATNSGAARPVYTANWMNGHPIVTFDGADELINSTANLMSSGGAARTIMIVGDGADSGGGGALFAFRRSSALFGPLLLHIAGTTYIFTDGASHNLWASSSQLSVLRAPFVATWRYAGGTADPTLRLNGSAVTLTSDGNPLTPASGAIGFTIGNRDDTGGQGWNGGIARIRIWDTVLDDTAAGTYETEDRTYYGF